MLWWAKLLSVHPHPRYGYIITIESQKWPWSKKVLREFVGDVTVWHETSNRGKRPGSSMESWFADVVWFHKYGHQNVIEV